MHMERILRLMAGVVVTTSVVLGHLMHPGWYLLTLFAGLNLLQSGLTNWCPAMWVLQKLGVKPCEQYHKKKQ